MMLLIVSMLLCGCDRPVDEDCWRGPVPIERVCDCLCGADLEAPPAPDDLSPAPAPAEPLSLRMTELMIDPVAVPDREGEWIKIHNPTPLPAPLKQISVAVRGSKRCTLPEDAIVPPFGFVVIARKPQGEQLPCPKLTLPNRAGEVSLMRGDEVVDVVVWKKAPKGAPLTSPQLHEE